MDLATSWEQHGADAIEACRKTSPVAYLRLVASVVPKEVGVHCGTPSPIEEMSDEDLTRLIATLLEGQNGE